MSTKPVAWLHVDAAHADLKALDKGENLDPVTFKLRAMRAGLHIAAALVTHLIEKDFSTEGENQ